MFLCGDMQTLYPYVYLCFYMLIYLGNATFTQH